MENCLASYARKAVSGQGFYFHIEKSGEAATVEVSRTGEIIQAAGPRNRYSDAAAHGARVLRQWAKDWPEELPPPRPLPRVQRAADLDLDLLLGDFAEVPF